MKADTLNIIDPALNLMAEFSKLSQGTSTKIQQMRQDVIFKEGHMAAKVKALAAMLWSINARCEPCVKYYAGQAKALGATEPELGEMLAVAVTMGGCVGQMWALKAYAAFKEADFSASATSCCG